MTLCDAAGRLTLTGSRPHPDTGVDVGLVMGGSQALARSLFAQIAPHTRSGEFFSLFRFMAQVSPEFGPILYAVVTGVLGRPGGRAGHHGADRLGRYRAALGGRGHRNRRR